MEQIVLNNDKLFSEFYNLSYEKIKNSHRENIISLVNNIPIFVNENDTNYEITIESINKNKILFLNERVTPILISLIKTESFEYGQKSQSIELVEFHLNDNNIATQNWFNTLYLKYFASDERILIGLLRIVEYLDENLLHPMGQTMAIASLVHKNNEIKELGVRIFESWNSLMSYSILKNLNVETLWLQNYINQVIKDIEIELCLS